MDEELNEQLYNIVKHTYSIYNCYKNIIIILQKSNIKGTELFLNLLIQGLINLKEQEHAIYCDFEDDNILVIKAIDFLSSAEKKFSKEMSDIDRLCYRRIITNFHILLSLANRDFLMQGIESFNNNSKYQFLISNGLDEIDALDFYCKFQYFYEKSIVNRFIYVVNKEIDNAKSRKDIDELIKIKLETAFVRSNELEYELIDSNFTSINSRFEDELKFDNPLSPTTFNDFVNIWTLESIHINLLKTTKCEKLDSLSKQLIMEFKTFLLYLSNENVAILRKNIIKMPFASNIIKNALIEKIDNLDEEKSIHYNNDSESKVI